MYIFSPGDACRVFVMESDIADLRSTLLYSDFQEDNCYISVTYIGNVTFPLKPFPFLRLLSFFPLFELSDHITNRLLCGSHIRK
jgi:hypothetical protein